MEFIKSATAEQGSQRLRQRLIQELQANKKVLWFVTGGSNIATSVAIMNQLEPSLTTNLTIALTDERFGPVGHADSNWEQLRKAGFNASHATIIPILQGEDMQTTAINYGQALSSAFAANEAVIAQFGMGADGHISGILPHTEAVNAQDLVFGYHTDQYDRITTTFSALRRCNIAYLFAFGEERRPVLESLKLDMSLNDQPAQILKQIPESYVYNDQIGEQS